MYAPQKKLAIYSKATGFTLIELLVLLCLLGTISAAVLPIYQRHVANTRLHEAQSALMHNTQFMERYYAQNARFTKNSTTWPKLPIQTTGFFNISFTGTARGAAAGTYRLQAVAKDKQIEPRYLTIDQNQNVSICQKTGTRTSCRTR